MGCPLEFHCQILGHQAQFSLGTIVVTSEFRAIKNDHITWLVGKLSRGPRFGCSIKISHTSKCINGKSRSRILSSTEKHHDVDIDKKTIKHQFVRHT